MLPGRTIITTDASLLEIKRMVRDETIDKFVELLKNKSTYKKSVLYEHYGYVSTEEIIEIAEQMKVGGMNESTENKEADTREKVKE